MSRSLHLALMALPLSLCPTVSAQSTVVSPTRAATQGGGGNSYPWSQGPMHYMQLHSDLKGQFRLVNQLSFRMDPGTGSYSGTRSIDLEMFMGNSVDYDAFSFTFASNYTATPMNVVARKLVNMGPQGPQGQPVSPFVGMNVPFDTPFPYVGVQSIAWEARVHGNTGTGSFESADALDSDNAQGATLLIGTGCTVTGRPLPMSMTAIAHQTCNHLTTLFDVSYAPSNAATVLAFGATNPNLSLQGLCGTLYTDFLLSVPVGTTDASGSFPRGGSAAFLFRTNPSPGAVVYTQMHSLDASSPYFVPVANSDGVRVTLPSLVPSKVTEVTRLYLYGNATGSDASVDYYGVVGYALATQFHY